MNVYLKMLIDFVGVFLIVMLVYKLFINKRRKEYENLKKSNEVRMIIDKYHLNMKKITYKKLLNTVTITNSFIIAFTSVIIIYIDKLVWGIMIGFVMLMVLSYSLYDLIGRYYKKKEDGKDV